MPCRWLPFVKLSVKHLINCRILWFFLLLCVVLPVFALFSRFVLQFFLIFYICCRLHLSLWCMLYDIKCCLIRCKFILGLYQIHLLCLLLVMWSERCSNCFRWIYWRNLLFNHAEPAFDFHQILFCWSLWPLKFYLCYWDISFACGWCLFLYLKTVSRWLVWLWYHRFSLLC